MANVKGGRFVKSLNFAIRNPNTGEDHFPGENGNWRFNKEKIDRLLENHEISFGEDGKGRPKLKRFLADVKEGVTWPSIWDFAPLNTRGSEEMAEIFGDALVFESPKPSGLLTDLVLLGSGPDDTVMDFFAGSGSIAHAVISLNEEKQAKRKFVLVQMAEPTRKILADGTVQGSAASRANLRTIAEIAKERVRRVIKTIDQKNTNSLDLLGNSQSDRGFRVFKLDESNILQWVPPLSSDKASLGDQLSMHIEHLRQGRTDLDILFELLLKAGFTLTTPIDRLEIANKTVFSIGGGVFLICLDRELNLDLIRAMAELKPSRVVCLDAGFAGNDQLKVNAVQTFKTKGVAKFQTV
jgi:adenine-specific DNA-methyltransferase